MADTTFRPAGFTKAQTLLAFMTAILMSSATSCVSTPSQNKSTTQATPVSGDDAEPNMLFYGSSSPARPEAHQGLLWFPFVWKPQLIQPKPNSGLVPIESLFIKDPRLVFINNQTKSETLISLRRDNSSGEQKIVLEQGKAQQDALFYLPRFIALSSGEYTVQSIRSEIGHGGAKSGTQVDMPLVNPFQLSASKPLVLSVPEGKTAALSRVVQTTSLSQSEQGVHLQSESESLDHNVVPVDLVAQQTSSVFPAESGSVLAASPDFPILRIHLTDHLGQSTQSLGNQVQAGFLMDVPCSVSGILKLVWKKVDEEREYLTQFPVNSNSTGCNSKQSLGYTFLLPRGDWMIKSSMISEKSAFEPDLQTEWLKAPGELLKSYFSLPSELFRWTLETIKEREIQRPLLIRVASLERRYDELRNQNDYFRSGESGTQKNILFLGHFEIKNTDKRKDKLKVHVLETFLKRSFDLKKAQELLGHSHVYNAYTLGRLTRSRGVKVNTVIRTSTNAEDDLLKVKPAAAEFRGVASRASTMCLTAREETDPLVSLDGELRFTVLKGADTVTLKKIKIGQSGLSDKWIETCLENEILSFRFAEKAPASFHGELKFSNE